MMKKRKLENVKVSYIEKPEGEQLILASKELLPSSQNTFEACSSRTTQSQRLLFHAIEDNLEYYAEASSVPSGRPSIVLGCYDPEKNTMTVENVQMAQIRCVPRRDLESISNIYPAEFHDMTEEKQKQYLLRIKKDSLGKFASKKAQKSRQTTSSYSAEGSINVREETLINSVAPATVATIEQPESPYFNLIPERNPRATKPAEIYDCSKIVPESLQDTLQIDNHLVIEHIAQNRAVALLDTLPTKPQFLKHVLKRWQEAPPKDAQNQVAQFKVIYFMSIFFDLVHDSQCNLQKFEARLKLPESEDGLGVEEPRMTKRYILKMLCDLLILCLSLNKYTCDLTLLVRDLAVKEGDLAKAFNKIGCRISTGMGKMLDQDGVERVVKTKIATLCLPLYNARKRVRGR